MTKKTVIVSLVALAFAASIPVSAMANPDFHGRYHRNYQNAATCPYLPQLTDEQKAQMEKFRKEHYDAVAPLRDSLMEKRMTLNALSRNPNTTPAELRQLTADITKLRTQIRTVNDDYFAKMEKAGIPCPGFRNQAGDRGFRHHDRGFRHHDRGYGMHHGYGR